MLEIGISFIWVFGIKLIIFVEGFDCNMELDKFAHVRLFILLLLLLSLLIIFQKPIDTNVDGEKEIHSNVFRVIIEDTVNSC